MNKWIVMIKIGNPVDRYGNVDTGFQRGHMWRRNPRIVQMMTLNGWRAAKDLELDIYNNGIKKINDLSKL